jgi:small subunit ribosomal protein S1
MKVTLAEERGFCFGVRRAIELATKTVEAGRPTYSLGPLIHNPQEIERLRGLGIQVADRLEDIPVPPPSTVIIRSHGTTPGTIEKAQARGLTVVDATCPLVKNAQRQARQMVEAGLTVLVVGDADHPEVQALLAHAAGAIVVSPEDEPDLVRLIAQGPAGERRRRLGVVAQTTQSPAAFRQVLTRLIEAEFGELRIANTICAATVAREACAVALAKQVDVMFVLGGRNSANTRQLAEACRATGVDTHHVETADDLDPAWLGGKSHAGVTAGASTPDWIIEAFVQRLTDLASG